jgi:hypothetical protein
MAGLAGNLFVYNDESVETSLGNWAGTGTNLTLVQDTTRAIDGTHSMKCTATATGLVAVTFGGTKPAITAGQTYQLSYYVYTTSSGVTGGAEVDWYVGATYKNYYQVTNLPLTPNAWTFITTSGVAPATTNAAVPQPVMLNATSGQVFWVDELYFGPPYTPSSGAGPPNTCSINQAVNRAASW